MKKLKCYVITVSEYFPKWHTSTPEETHFVHKILDKEKTHTIRLNYDLWKKRIEKVNKGEAYISLRFWTGKPYRSKQYEFKCIFKAGIQKVRLGRNSVSSCVVVEGVPIHTPKVASNDGLDTKDFIDWFFTQQKTNIIDAAIIHFTEFRY